MRFLLAVLAIPSFALAAEKPLCEIQWKVPTGKTTTLQFAFIEKGCAMEGASRVDCYVVRKKSGKAWTLGEGIIRKGVAPSTLCMAPELFNEGEIQANLICDSQKKPQSIQLSGPGSVKKTCPLPKRFP
ncbi:MAG: hypothetical protein ACJ763_10565 [Bdellovibrionia bacterium]